MSESENRYFDIMQSLLKIMIIQVIKYITLLQIILLHNLTCPFEKKRDMQTSMLLHDVNR